MPDELASKVIDKLSLKVIQGYHKTKKDLTVKEYYILIAKMGGFLDRKSDGDPGWQTLWKGQIQLYWMIEGAIAEELNVRTKIVSSSEHTNRKIYSNI